MKTVVAMLLAGVTLLNLGGEARADGCSGTPEEITLAHGESRTITSTNHPDFYPKNEDCQWNIEATNAKLDIVCDPVTYDRRSMLIVAHGSTSIIVPSQKRRPVPFEYTITSVTTASASVFWATGRRKSRKIGFSCTVTATALPQQLDCDCGVRNPTGVNRVIDGVDTEQNEWPWMVGLFLKSNTARGIFCGGSLISTDWVMTAAHCPIGLSAEEIEVRLGDHNQFDNDFIRRDVLAIIIHEEYNPNIVTSDWDIALLKISPVNFEAITDNSIGTVCLASGSDGDFAGDDAVAIGWGLTGSPQLDTSDVSPILQELPSVVYSKDVCNANYYGGDVTGKMVCAAGEQPPGSICSGDSGSSLNFETPEGYWKVIGITSWATSNCNQENLAGYPGVFLRVSEFENWIFSHVDVGNTCSPPTA